jgi:sulfur carrier protein
LSKDRCAIPNHFYTKTGGEIMVTVNGENCQLDGLDVLTMLSQKGYVLTRVVTELNGQIVPKSAYEKTILKSGDVVEVVSFVGGG